MGDSNMSYLYTVGGYATLIGVGYVIYQISTQKSKKKVATSQAKTAKQPQAEPRKEDRKKRQRFETFASESQQASKSQSSTKAPEPNPWLSNVDTKENDADNREFARQLAKAKEGTKFSTSSEGGKQREKSVKQSQANRINDAAEANLSGGGSTTGAEADDDRSEPAASPEATPVDASGVADMLEPAPAGPSILRLTDTSSKQKKPKAAKAPEQVETKKQRQNRKKAEAARAARQDAEKERKVLEEKQRRAARIASGRPAKDGSAYVAANGNKSAWSQGAPAEASSKAEPTNGLHQPLDTFEPATAGANGKNSASESEAAWMSSLPSEEEQMDMLKDDADDWSTVKTKSKKGSKSQATEPSSKPTPKQQAGQNGHSSSKVPPQSSFGAFSALTTNDDSIDAEEEEQAEEW